MARNSRRTLLKSAAAGAVAIGLVGAGRGLAGSAVARGSIETSSAPLVAYVSDARTGEIVVMVGTREIVRRDAALVARIVAIAKEAGDVVSS
ncbi:MAG TPA: hypothetical protein VGR85_04025 [Candidatus Limnocylindria bacterium]|jgi:hypothetical protein|nr:hypothetical protein [Candidatus Limnocylindria bacterium]